MYLPLEKKTDLPVDRDILNFLHVVRMMYITVERDLLRYMWKESCTYQCRERMNC